MKSRVEFRAQMVTPKKTLTELDELEYQLTNLQIVHDLFFHHRLYTTYKLAAMILRTVVIGSSGDPPFVTKCLAGPRLPKLAVPDEPHASPAHLRMPATVELGGVTFSAGVYIQTLEVHGSAVASEKVGDLFDECGLIPLAEWLDQTFLEPPLTLRSFIQRVAHKEGGAHVDLSDKQLAVFQACGFLHWPFVA